MNVIFLDYDGVVNTPLWDSDGVECRYGMLFDNKVNDFQCVQWLSEFCEKHNYHIVVTSSWRFDRNWRECLINGGLRKGIKILGRTPRWNDRCRGDEIQQYLDEHPEIENFIILDDDNHMGHLIDHLVRCHYAIGFRRPEYDKAEDLHRKLAKYDQSKGSS